MPTVAVIVRDITPADEEGAQAVFRFFTDFILRPQIQLGTMMQSSVLPHWSPEYYLGYDGCNREGQFVNTQQFDSKRGTYSFTMYLWVQDW